MRRVPFPWPCPQGDGELRAASESYDDPAHEHDEEREEQQVDPQLVVPGPRQALQPTHRGFQEVAALVKIRILQPFEGQRLTLSPPFVDSRGVM